MAYVSVAANAQVLRARCSREPDQPDRKRGWLPREAQSIRENRAGAVLFRRGRGEAPTSPFGESEDGRGARPPAPYRLGRGAIAWQWRRHDAVRAAENACPGLFLPGPRRSRHRRGNRARTQARDNPPQPNPTAPARAKTTSPLSGTRSASARGMPAANKPSMSRAATMG